MLVSCDLMDIKLALVNNTGKPIYYHLSYDTIIANNKEYLESSNIFPAESVNPPFARGGKGGWEYGINNISKDSTLRIFFFMADNGSLSLRQRRINYLNKKFKISQENNKGIA